MSRTPFLLLVAVVVLVAALSIEPPRARACGGCFAPSANVVVTAHRMAVSINPTETTLWDQIQYAGEPEDFVWVLPVVGDVGVELADNAFFEALEGGTRINLQGTFSFAGCPDPCAGGGFGFGASAGDRGGAPEDEVMVFREEVIGPYETATIGSEDPMALVTWLRDNGYAVADEILPVIEHYVALDMNFAALRLNPNAGVDQMQPVRVTTPGMNPVFPLRMVSAGVTDSVGLEIYVFAEGRWEAANFGNATIDASELVFDWSRGSGGAFNYEDVFTATVERTEGGRAWITEYSGLPPDTLNWWSTRDDDGTVHTPAEDFAVVTRGFSTPTLTKLRTDLRVEHLGEDLVLQASLTGGEVSNQIFVERDVNRPVCPTVCADPTRPGGGTVGSPAGGSIGFGTARGDGVCAVAPMSAGKRFSLALLGLLGLTLFWRRRSR